MTGPNGLELVHLNGGLGAPRCCAAESDVTSVRANVTCPECIPRTATEVLEQQYQQREREAERRHDDESGEFDRHHGISAQETEQQAREVERSHYRDQDALDEQERQRQNEPGPTCQQMERLIEAQEKIADQLTRIAAKL